jgi:hypothetical protein
VIAENANDFVEPPEDEVGIAGTSCLTIRNSEPGIPETGFMQLM